MRRSVSRICAVLICQGLSLMASGQELDRIPIDDDRPEFATEMSFVFSEVFDDVGWAVWNAYQAGNEKVLAREISLSGLRSTVTELSEGLKSIHGIEVGLVKNGGEPQARVAWAEHANGAWKINSRPWRRGEKWVFESDGGKTDSDHLAEILPASWQDSLVWTALDHSGRASIQLDANAKSHSISDSQTLGFRPSILRSGDSIFCFWDQYESRAQWIAARKMGSDTIERVSPPDSKGRNLDPVPLDSNSEGLCVAWVKLTDVIGGDGVVDMIHTAHVARRTGEGEWEIVTDENGSDEGAVMLNGLLPDLRKGKGYPSGYSGRRRHPMLLDGGEDGAWLIWERKSKHSGSGTKTAGQLLGRRFKDGKWMTKPLLLQEGLIDYRLAKPERVRDDGHTFYVVGSDIPKNWIRPSYLVAVDLRKAKPIELDDWRDQFDPVKLPFEDEPKERYSTGIGEKKYHLYWGDLHCHSGLTGDAEGEPDEIVLYARDRAKLDVMVLQDNDEVHGRILTEGDYQMGVTHSQWITEPGKFVALPGYEWTQRTSKNGVPDPFGSAFEQSFPNGYPNHRTVIYPMKGGPIVRYFEVGHNFKLMADTVYENGGILHSQHPAFEISDHPAETNLEVTACWGIYIRSVPERFHGELNKGRRMGFIGTSDSHRRNPGLCGGLTGIYAEELTPEAIHDALRAHRVFATNGSKIVIDSRIDGRLSDEVVRSENGAVDLSLFLYGTRPITRVKLMGDSRTVAEFQGDGSAELRIEKRIEGLEKGDHWFYWAIEQEGNSTQYSGNISVARGNLAWSSPHFVEVE